MQLRKDLHYWDCIELPDGTVTPGKGDKRNQPKYLGLENSDLIQGTRVLDVGALDGFWGFWAERQGAEYALTVDVECYANYDWGYDGPPEGLVTRPSERKDQVFYYLKDLIQSEVAREHISVYDLDPEQHGKFDLVFCYGLLYHLRHPLLGIDKMRAVCQGALVIETHTLACSANIPMMTFYEDDVLDNALTNWCGPTQSCVAHWMKSAGFKSMYVQKQDNEKNRHRIIGTVDKKWDDVFQGNPNFILCDDLYFQNARQSLQRALSRDTRFDLCLGRTSTGKRKLLRSLLRRLKKK